MIWQILVTSIWNLFEILNMNFFHKKCHLFPDLSLIYIYSIMFGSVSCDSELFYDPWNFYSVSTLSFVCWYLWDFSYDTMDPTCQKRLGNSYTWCLGQKEESGMYTSDLKFFREFLLSSFDVISHALTNALTNARLGKLVLIRNIIRLWSLVVVAGYSVQWFILLQHAVTNIRRAMFIQKRIWYNQDVPRLMVNRLVLYVKMYREENIKLFY